MSTTDDLQAYVKGTEARIQAYWPRAWLVVTCWPTRWTMNVHSMPEGFRLTAEGETLPEMLAKFEVAFIEARSKIWSEDDLRKTLGVEPRIMDCAVVVEQIREDDVITHLI